MLVTSRTVWTGSSFNSLIYISGVISADRQAVSGLFGGANVAAVDLFSTRRDATGNQLSVEQNDVTGVGR